MMVRGIAEADDTRVAQLTEVRSGTLRTSLAAARMESMMTQAIASVFWRRLDQPGHDAAWLELTSAGWLLHGVAVFREGDLPAWLAYQVACDLTWATVRGEIRGRVGDNQVAFVIDRSAGGWTVNGTPVAGLDDVVDLDLGFTPATNMLQLRRVGLAVGEVADFSVAWCDGLSERLERLPQHYERRTEDTYWYESPASGYTATLVVGPDDFVRDYPGLWEAEGPGYTR